MKSIKSSEPSGRKKIFSLRYAGGRWDLRQLFIRLVAFLQRKPVLILDSDPQACARVLASSDRKGSFIEHLFAIPAWSPIYSIESEDGSTWETLAQYCSKILTELPWEQRLGPALTLSIKRLQEHVIPSEHSDTKDLTQEHVLPSKHSDTKDLTQEHVLPSKHSDTKDLTQEHVLPSKHSDTKDLTQEHVLPSKHSDTKDLTQEHVLPSKHSDTKDLTQEHVLPSKHSDTKDLTQEHVIPSEPCESRDLGCPKETSKGKRAIVDGEALSRLTLRTLFMILFTKEIAKADEDLFYTASLEWRKEIAVKGPANREIKEAFCKRLLAILQDSDYAPGFTSATDHKLFLSVFAQPFIISPQINISDIMAAVWFFLEKHNLYDQALSAAKTNDDLYLHGIIMESIRLRHPFPILERELTRRTQVQGKKYEAGTQVLMLFDQFKQEQDFKPERWQKRADNPFHGMPFGSGRRMCLGSSLATRLMQELLKALVLSFPKAVIQPSHGHLYSGRDNDQARSFKESLYQLKIFFLVLIRSRKIGQTKKSCPFHRKS